MSTFNKISSHDYQSSTMSNLRARIFWMIWETDTEMAPNSLVFQWIKDAINELNIRDVFYFQDMEWEIKLQDWENSVALPTWFKTNKRLRVYNDSEWTYWTELHYVQPHIYNESNTSFTMQNNKLLLPTSTWVTKYRIDYSWLPETPSNDLSYSLIPLQYDELIINYVVSKLKMSEWDMADAHTFMVMFENAIERLKLDSVRRAYTSDQWHLWMNKAV